MTTINRDHFEEHVEKDFDLPANTLKDHRAVDQYGEEGYLGFSSSVAEDVINGMWFSWKAAKEDNWKNGDVWSDGEYDMSIHSNPDAVAWAKFFVETFPRCGVDEETMAGWFANAMMARHDYDQRQGTSVEMIDAIRNSQ